jgi:rhodanese-related sulfurtransferase
MAQTANDLVAAAKKNIREISPATLHEWAGREFTLIDVREPAEFAAGHLPGAVNLPRGLLEFQIESPPVSADRSRTLVVYCLSGGRAALAADSLQQLGFTQVHSLAGGIAAWRNAALPVVTE